MSRGQLESDALYRDPELAQFYDADNGQGPDIDFCLQLASTARSVLDLGCGTGQLAARLADCRDVVGVDPAAAVLEIAQRRPNGDRATWVEADARDVRLGRRFDLVVLTGHAFQVFLTAQDQRAVLLTIAKHLADGGRFVFDTRNPKAEEWEEWGPEDSKRSFEHPRHGRVEAWNDAVHDTATGIVTYQTHYRIVGSDHQFSAASKILFTPRDTLDGMVRDAGLIVDRWLGDWLGAGYGPDAADIIPIGRLN